MEKKEPSPSGSAARERSLNISMKVKRLKTFFLAWLVSLPVRVTRSAQRAMHFYALASCCAVELYVIERERKFSRAVPTEVNILAAAVLSVY